MKIQARNLRTGDYLGGGCKIVSNPVSIGTYMGQKNRISIGVQYGDKEPLTRVWGASTTVTVLNR